MIALGDVQTHLLAGGADDDSAQHPMFIDVLRKMSATEAQAFHLLVGGGIKAQSGEIGALVPSGQWIGCRPRPQNTNTTGIARLEALGLARCLESTMFFQPERMGHLTEFGWDLARAVRIAR